MIPNRASRGAMIVTGRRNVDPAPQVMFAAGFAFVRLYPSMNTPIVRALKLNVFSTRVSNRMMLSCRRLLIGSVRSRCDP